MFHAYFDFADFFFRFSGIRDWKRRTSPPDLGILLTKYSTLFSNFIIEKIACKNFCNCFHCEFYAQKFAKNSQKFLLIRLNAVDFNRFSQLLVEVKNAKNWICIISDNSSNIAAIGLKICRKQSWEKCFRILDTRSHLGWGTVFHGNPARPFGEHDERQ